MLHDIKNQQNSMNNFATSFELTLPENRKFFRVGEIPALTAAAIYPRLLKGVPALSDVQKIMPGKSRPCPLDENDIAEIANCIGDSLPEDLVSQFNESRNNSEWRLVPIWEGDSQWLGQSIQRAALEEEHEKQLLAAIQRGELKPLNPLTYCSENYTVGDAGKNSLIPVEEFTNFAKLLRINVTLVAANAESKEEPKEEIQLDSSPKPKRKAPDAFIAALLRLLVEIGKRSAEKERPFDVSAMPGVKADFRVVAEKFDAELDKTPRTFDDYLAGLCQFKLGARPSDFYAKLFPEYSK